MKILFNNSGQVDLEKPIYMEEDQFDKFKNFLKKLLNEDINIREVSEKERFINPDTKRLPKKWNENELLLLLDPKIEESELIKKLGRSQMSISMQRAQFVPDFISWAKSKKLGLGKITKLLIKQFLEEKHGNT